MDAEDKQIEYLEVKEFLARNQSVKARTFTRWKQKKLIDFIQPGGPGTQILVPEDALQRMEKRRQGPNKTGNVGKNSKPHPDAKPRGVRQPDWKRNPQSNTKKKGR